MRAALASAFQGAVGEQPTIEFGVRATLGSGITGLHVKALDSSGKVAHEDPAAVARDVPQIDIQNQRSIARMLRLMCTQVCGGPQGNRGVGTGGMHEAEAHDGTSREFLARAPSLLPRAQAKPLTGRFGTLACMARPLKRARGREGVL